VSDLQVTTEIQVVREFLGALERLDVEAAAALLDEAAVYQNVPFPPARGRAAVVEQLRGFTRVARGFEVHHHNVAADGPTVLTERTDVLVLGPVRWRFWVCGTFEVHDGRITLWRDRFDFVNLAWGLGRGAVKAALGRGASTR
jgi:limonene-1,2-epoxide hydrolase